MLETNQTIPANFFFSFVSTEALFEEKNSNFQRYIDRFEEHSNKGCCGNTE